MHKPKKKMTSSVVHKNPFYQVRKDVFLRNNGKKGEYYVVTVNPFVIMCALSKNRKHVYLIKNWRYPLNRYNLEFPAGRVDKNETPLMAAKRELLEETGLKGKKWKSLGWFFLSPGNSNQKGYVYVIEHLEKIPNYELDDEIVDVMKVPISKLKGLLKKRTIAGAPSLIAAQKLIDYLEG